MSRARNSRRAPPPGRPSFAIPLSPRRLWQLLAASFSLLLLVAAGLWATAAGLPARTAMQAATFGARAGFTVRQVDISGIVNQPRLSVYRQLLHGGSDSMFLIDLPEARERLVELPWVADASIIRHWPDRLEVRVTERSPAAIWQYRGEMHLIDRDGNVLPADNLPDWAELPLLVGAEARHEVTNLLQLIDRHPEIARQMKGAQWLGQERWDLRMLSGETISLPRGADAGPALAAFARENLERPLLGRGFLRFDLRIPDQMIVQVKTDGDSLPKPRKPKAAPKIPPAPSLAPQSAPGSAPANPLANPPVAASRPRPPANGGLV